MGIIFPMRFYLIVIYWKEQKNPDSVEQCNQSSSADIYIRKIYFKKSKNAAFFKHLKEAQKTKLNLVKNNNTYHIILYI